MDSALWAPTPSSLSSRDLHGCGSPTGCTEALQPRTPSPATHQRSNGTTWSPMSGLPSLSSRAQTVEWVRTQRGRERCPVAGEPAESQHVGARMCQAPSCPGLRGRSTGTGRPADRRPRARLTARLTALHAAGMGLPHGDAARQTAVAAGPQFALGLHSPPRDPHPPPHLSVNPEISELNRTQFRTLMGHGLPVGRLSLAGAPGLEASLGFLACDPRPRTDTAERRSSAADRPVLTRGRQPAQGQLLPIGRDRADEATRRPGGPRMPH